MDWHKILTDFLSTVIPALVTALSALASWGLVELAKYLRAKSAAVHDESLRAYFDDAITRASDAVRLAVKETAQTYVSNIKGTEAWTKDAQMLAFGMAKDKAMAILGDAGRAALSDAVADWEAWIIAKIEATVKGADW